MRRASVKPPSNGRMSRCGGSNGSLSRSGVSFDPSMVPHVDTFQMRHPDLLRQLDVLKWQPDFHVW